MPSHGGDLAARQSLLQGRRIVDEIRFAQANAEKSSAGQDGSKAARDGFYFGKFRHGTDSTLTHADRMLNLAERKENTKAEARAGENLS